MTIIQFNYLEAGLWFSIALVLLAAALIRRKRHKPFKTGLLAGAVFVVFAVSDLVETQTGAWWRPLWLLFLKAICVIILSACYYRYRQIKPER